ncbi:MAG: DUF433 domain-containing protein [Candidatus Loosdrechtia sp.]|uniref:DUF433 domain-containing protein n=1 Tax=Candidatus Loosdrechtia sp. TaxID=3101272 RepID=UPI003A5E7571|nr:MAG: DUF433 domain-containing protein [Candidatus Jettenia sp. AMX2]
MDNRIEVNPDICHGQPCIKGTRIMVYIIIELLEAGLTHDDITKDYYPQITKDDIKQCLHYASLRTTMTTPSKEDLSYYRNRDTE